MPSRVEAEFGENPDLKIESSFLNVRSMILNGRNQATVAGIKAILLI